MTVYIVSYDLNKAGQNYNGLYEELKKSTSWYHPLDSTWLVYTGETAQQLYNRLSRSLDQNDHILVIEVKPNYFGFLPQDAWTWIKSHLG